MGDELHARRRERETERERMRKRSSRSKKRWNETSKTSSKLCLSPPLIFKMADSPQTSAEKKTAGRTSNACDEPLVQVVVDVLSAVGLKNMDFIGKSDPYVVLQLGSQKRKTKVGPTSTKIRNELFL